MFNSQNRALSSSYRRHPVQRRTKNEKCKRLHSAMISPSLFWLNKWMAFGAFEPWTPGQDELMGLDMERTFPHLNFIVESLGISGIPGSVFADALLINYLYLFLFPAASFIAPQIDRNKSRMKHQLVHCTDIKWLTLSLWRTVPDFIDWLSREKDKPRANNHVLNMINHQKKGVFIKL